MRIALLGPAYPFRGGIAHYTYHLARTMALNHEVQIISYKYQYPRWLYPGKSDLDPSDQVLQLPATYLLDPFNLFNWQKTVNHIRSIDPDILVLQWWVPVWAFAYTYLNYRIRKSGGISLFIIHNVYPHEKIPLYKSLSRLTLRTTPHHLVHNQYEKDRLLEILPTANPKYIPFPIYDGLNTSDRLITRSQAKIELGLSISAHVLLFFGIVRPYKGLSVLLKALSLIKEQYPQIILVIAGEFWESIEKYRRMIQDMGLEDRIIIDNRYIPNEEIGKYFEASDVVVAPYTAGTQSAVAALALAYRKPLIVTDHIASALPNSFRELVTVIPANDWTSLANAIITSTKSPHLVETSIIEAQDTGWDQIAQYIEQVARQKDSK